MKILFLIFVLAISFFNTASAQQTENLIIAVIDGARYAETFGDSTHQYIPHLWNQLRPLGTLYTSFFNDGLTQTNPGHASIVTGTWQSITNDGEQRPYQPTVFEYYRKQKSAPATENFVVLGKTKLDILAYSDHPDFGFAYSATVDSTSSQYNDVYTLENIKDLIASNHPHLSIVCFSGTDKAAHDGPWSNYITKLQRADSAVTELWNFIQTDPTFKDKTTLIITNDHGRHTNDFRSHGDGCEGCRHISLLIMGPDTPPGNIFPFRHNQTDIAPTIGRLLNFNADFSTGRIINSALSLPTAATYHVLEQWNLISISRKLDSHHMPDIFPTAVSPAFAYADSYVIQDTLEIGKGYWINFPAEQFIPLDGYEIFSDTINIQEGWNLIGSLSVPFAVRNISSDSPGLTLTNFFKYNGVYQETDTLFPGWGYWVKASQAASVYLNSGMSAHPVSIIKSGDMPPPPPTPQSGKEQLSFSLAQNYPNPFNPVTLISYNLQSESKVSLKLYSIIGQEIATLIDGFQDAGYNSVQFNAGGYPSGVYLYKLTAESQGNVFVAVRKLMLLK